MKEWQTMRTFINIIAAVLLTAVCSWADEPSKSAREAVLQAEQRWKTAVLKCDRSALEGLMADDLSYTHSSAKTQTKAQFIEDATGGATVYKSIEFDGTKLRQYGNVVVLTQKAVITTVQTGISHLYLTEVWAQKEGHWQMASRQATKLP